jgi:hypothetical protein
MVAEAVMFSMAWFPGSRPIVRLAAATALALSAAAPAHAHIVPLADMLHGIRMTPAQCASIPQTVWVNAMGRDYCIRYYLSTVGGEGARPVMFLQGDRFGRLDFRTGAFALGPRDKDIDTDDFVRWADSMSKQYKTSAIYLARVGLDGSSGDHRIRHSMLELRATNAALDAIKKRHNFEGYHLIGQSGGSALVGGMLALRSDIGCAVIGSGRLAINRPPRPATDPARDFFNVADAVGAIAQKRATRILLLTDPADKKVPEPTQTGFVQKLRHAGGQAEQFIVQATDDDHHGVVAYARTAAAGCLRGASNDDIAQQIQKQIEKRLAAKARAGQGEQKSAPPRTNAAATSGPGSAQPATGR